jgi:hypothetical protein
MSSGSGCLKCACRVFRWNPASMMRMLICHIRDPHHRHCEGCYSPEAIRNCLCGHHMKHHG